MIPKAIWGVLGLVLLVLAGLGWLRLHDSRVRQTAEAHITIQAKDDTIHTLRGAIVALGRAIKSADSAWFADKGAVVRVAYTPQRVRDSLEMLTRTVTDAQARGDTAVPIGTAVQLAGEIKACRRQVDTIAAAVSGMARDCEQRVAVRDSVIQAQKETERLMADRMAQVRQLPRIASARLVPFVDLNRSLARKSWEADAGATLHLFAGLHVQALARVGENLGTDSIGVRDSQPITTRRHWDALVGGHYEIR